MALEQNSATRTYPTARREHIVGEEVLDEFVVYDLASNKVHSLNPSAAFVWRGLDGKTSKEDLAKFVAGRFGISVSVAEPIVELALKQLHTARLLENAEGTPRSVITRREVLRRIGIGAAATAAVPVIMTLTAPAAYAQATEPIGGPCHDDTDCRQYPGSNRVICCGNGTKLHPNTCQFQGDC